MGFPIKHAQLSSQTADNQIPVSQNIIPVACKQPNHGFQVPLSLFLVTVLSTMFTVSASKRAKIQVRFYSSAA